MNWHNLSCVRDSEYSLKHTIGVWSIDYAIIYNNEYNRLYPMGEQDDKQYIVLFVHVGEIRMDKGTGSSAGMDNQRSMEEIKRHATTMEK